MPDKKLLSLRFASVSGLIEYNLGCNSSDNIPITNPPNWFISKENPLNQVGCNFVVPDSTNASGGAVQQVAIHDALDKSGYGTRNPFLPNINVVNTLKLYLNGLPSLNGVDMPYLMWVQGTYCHVLHYFRADGTDLGTIMYNLGTVGLQYCGWYAGQLYSDGTFKGCAGPIRQHTIPGLGVISHKQYEWYCTQVITEPIQAMNPLVVEDIQEYLPIEPEGAFTDSGNGDFDSSSDPVNFPDLPTLNALDSGLTAMYEMTTAQMQSLSQFLWSNLFDLNTFKKMFNDPMEAILNVCISPVDITTDGILSQIRIGNINTGVQGTRVFNPYKIIDFGTINLNEYWANYADYSPYTKLSIFLPYVGVQQISIDDVMNGSIQLKAYCDVLTGSIQYILKSSQGNRRGHGHDSVLYTWGGNCQYQIPLSASNMTSVINSIISTTTSVAGAIIATAATEGVAAPVAIAGAVGSTASGVANAKTTVQRGGGLGGAVGLFGVQTPYLILERPELITPNEYPNNVGIPNEKADYIKNYAGYVKVKECHLSIPGATADDLNEIESILKEGILV